MPNGTLHPYTDNNLAPLGVKGIKQTSSGTSLIRETTKTELTLTEKTNPVYSVHLTVEDEPVSFQLYDTAGQVRVKNSFVRTSFFRQIVFLEK